MPRCNSKNIFDPDKIDSPMIGLAFDKHPTTPGEHYHQKGQLLYCSQGVTNFYCQGRYFLLPPTKLRE